MDRDHDRALASDGPITYICNRNTQHSTPMNTKHTPGPWTHGSAYLSGVADIRDKSGDLIAQVVSGTFIGMKEQSANARLIAAAPCLLAFAQKVSDGGHDMADLMTEARSVIAKATGNTNL